MFNRRNATKTGSMTRLTMLAATAGIAAMTAAPASATDGTTATGSNDAQEMLVPLVQPSVVYETITWSGYVYDTYNHGYVGPSRPYSVVMQCTGFVVNPDGWIGTAGHCVDPVEGKDIIRQAAAEWAVSNHYYQDHTLTTDQILAFNDFRVDNATSDASDVLKHNTVGRAVNVSWAASVSGVAVNKNKPVRVVAFQHPELGDAALLKADETDLNAIPLADTSTGKVTINSDITAIGYPAIIDSYTDPDLTPTFDNGTVSSIKTIGDDLLSVYQVSAALSGGMSGGPAVNDSGAVVGVNSSHFPGEPFNYVVPAERIQELLASSGVTNTLSDVTLTYRAGIAAFFAGDKASAVEKLQSVVTSQPLNTLASDYLAKAKALPDPEPVGGSGHGQSVLWLAIGAAAALAAGITGLLFFRRRHGNDRGIDSAATGGAPSGQPESPAAAPVGPLANPAALSQYGNDTLVAAVPAVTSSTVMTESPVGFAPAQPAPGSGFPSASAAGVVSIGSVPGPGSATRSPQRDGEVPRFCTVCGAVAVPSFTFCGGCGRHL